MAAIQSSIWVPPPVQPPRNGNCGRSTDTLVLTEPGRLDLRLYRGDSGRFTVRVQMPDGTPIDITGAAWDCDVRTDVWAEPPLTSLRVVEIPGSIHEVEVIIAVEDSIAIADGLAVAAQELGVWDLQMLLGGETMTILRGHVCCVDDVSRPPVVP